MTSRDWITETHEPDLSWPVRIRIDVVGEPVGYLLCRTDTWRARDPAMAILAGYATDRLFSTPHLALSHLFDARGVWRRLLPRLGLPHPPPAEDLPVTHIGPE